MLLDLLLPQRCVSCAAPGTPWCAHCALPPGPPLRVHRPAMLRGVGAYALADYDGSARAAVLAFKERGRRQLATPFGALLATALTAVRDPPADGVWWLVPAPSKASLARARGGAHMQRVARRCAAALAAAGQQAAVAPALRLTGPVRDSVGLDAAARAANLAGRVRVVPGGLPPPGTSVVLLDDVLTTGATAGACVTALTRAGIAINCVLTITAVIRPRYGNSNVKKRKCATGKLSRAGPGRGTTGGAG